MNVVIADSVGELRQAGLGLTDGAHMSYHITAWHVCVQRGDRYEYVVDGDAGSQWTTSTRTVLLLDSLSMGVQHTISVRAIPVDSCTGSTYYHHHRCHCHCHCHKSTQLCVGPYMIEPIAVTSNLNVRPDVKLSQ